MKTSSARSKFFKLSIKHLSSIWLVFMVSTFTWAQEGVFKNLDEALINKDEVRVLRLQGKKYTQVPKEILEFENLEVLSLKKNKIDSLPGWFGELMIYELNLAKNRFTAFPKILFKMQLLEYLDLSENEIEILEGEFEQMKSIKVLDLWGNLIEDIPFEMTEMTQLTKLDLRLMEFNRFKQQEILEMFPEVEVFMSPPCNCK